MQRQLDDPPYGWPRDAIDGALLALLANGNIRADRDGHPIAGPKELPATQIGRATFYKEDEPPSTSERMAVRGLLLAAKVPYTTGQEGAAISGLLQHMADLADRAGGDAPLPARPDIAHIEGLNALGGNQQFRAVAHASEQLRQETGLWSAAVETRNGREHAWSTLDRLLEHAASLDQAGEVRTQRDAILTNRMLLSDPNPISPLIDQLCTALRAALSKALEATRSAYQAEIDAVADTEQWAALSAEQQQKVLADARLALPDKPDLSGNEQLLAALAKRPLSVHQEQIDALPAKGQAARKAIAEIFEPEPKVTTVKPTSATLKSEADVDQYLTELRQRLMKHVDAGETIII